MIVYPGCKINIGLNITKKLPNGYHALESVFYPILLSDILEVSKQSETKDSQFVYSGIEIPGDSESNIIKRAYEILKLDYDLPPIKVHLHKIVPMGAGLGGGSADASAILLLLNKLFELTISKEKLLKYAAELGADCPFFIINKPAFVSGIGQEIHEIDLELSGKSILIVNPNLHINTGDAFNNITPKKLKQTFKSKVLNTNSSTWKSSILNDFEEYVFRKYPEVLQVKETLYEMGAEYASLSGSGSTVYGIFKSTSIDIPIELNKYFTYFEEL